MKNIEFIFDEKIDCGYKDMKFYWGICQILCLHIYKLLHINKFSDNFNSRTSLVENLYCKILSIEYIKSQNYYNVKFSFGYFSELEKFINTSINKTSKTDYREIKIPQLDSFLISYLKTDKLFLWES